MLQSGVYEQIINIVIEKYITSEEGKQLYYFGTDNIDAEEAAKLLSRYVTDISEQCLHLLKDSGGDLAEQINLVNRIIGLLGSEAERSAGCGEEIKKQFVSDKGELLIAVAAKKNNICGNNKLSKIERPVSSLAQSSLFTGAVNEPSMFMELKKEILSADRVDMLVSFIKWSGLRLIYDELYEFTKRGRLRVITTSYMGATDVKAVEMLRELSNTEIKVSYETKRTRLHAKSYVFYRNSGFTTAYVGSSNLSNAAISSGLEWNVKVASKDLPYIVKKVEATFEAYWNDKEFQCYQKKDRDSLVRALQAERHAETQDSIFSFDIRPYDYQKEILDKLEAERNIRGHYRNIVVAATGTGKTVISAFDYKRFCEMNPKRANRLLFIAHREEILKQSIACFRGVMKDQNFGELFVGKFQPQSMDHLFLSIQTFNSRDFSSRTNQEFYDYIVVDEFHHAAADTYQKLLDYYKPQILLGLTATPERMDGKSVLTWFDERIAAEIRLPEAIDRKLLSPFHYFGVTDCVDLSTLRWTKGSYDKVELQNVYTGNKRRAELIVRSLYKYVTDMQEVRGLGFCVSIAHAVFMADFFTACKISSMALTSASPDYVRKEAQSKLVSGEIKFIFVVDLYNEGVDIPEVNTILFLRPTESLTVFLQQLGRGLRLYKDKECLTVLDFIGQSNKKYNFAEKIGALLNHCRRGVEREIKDGFLSLPRGSFIQLEKVAKEHILNNIRSFLSGKSSLVTRIAAFEEDTGKKLSYQNFMEHYHIDRKGMYPAYSFARLCVFAGVQEDFEEQLEETITKALGKICEINSRRWICCLLDILPKIDELSLESIDSHTKTMLLMLHYTIYRQPVTIAGFNNVIKSIAVIKKNPVMFNELMELLRFNLEHIDFIDKPVYLGGDFSLDLHCTYSRDQLLAALGYYTEDKMPVMREGVKYLPNQKLDILLITLNKSDKDYSPSTLYDDFSINEVLFHWQSQSTTSEQSATGQRYIQHKQRGSKIALFAREYKKDKGGACPYMFLGLADYVTHIGSRPMSITWRLHDPIPAKLLKKTNKLIIG